jgi:hypothetical protein
MTVKEFKKKNPHLAPYLSTVDGEVEIGQTSDGYHTFDGLYEHRCYLFAALAKALCLFSAAKCWKSLNHSDGSFYDGWFVMGIGTDKGDQITYHLPRKMWNDCDDIPTVENAPEWDGHTANDVLQRLKLFLHPDNVQS